MKMFLISFFLYFATFRISFANYEPVRKFHVLQTAVLNCSSVDDLHNFYYWHHLDSQNIIGPYNEEDFDKTRYEYEVLSGNLTIRNITKKQAGIYDCVSRSVESESTKITTVKVIVSGDIEEAEAEVNSLRIIIAICSLALFFSFCFVAYRVWKDRYVHPRYLDQFEEDEDENEEIYRAPSTSGLIKQSIIRENPSLQKPLISTDFNSILDSKI